MINPKTLHYRETKPEDMMRREIFNLKNADQVEKALYVSEIERYQIKIEQMEMRNTERIRTYRTVVYSFNAMIGSGIILLLLSI